MPKTKFQNFIFTVIMLICMVYAMVCYNIAIDMGGMKNEIFIFALSELPVMCTIGFIFEYFIVGNAVAKITFSTLDPVKTQPIFITIMISALTVVFMCPIMSFFASVLFSFNGMENIIANWLTITIRNFPMALCWQLFVAGPVVRFIFRKLFSRQLEVRNA